MDIFNPVDFETSIIKKQLVTYKPNLESYKYNDRIKITVNSSTFTELFNSYIYLRIKVKNIPTSVANNKIAIVRNGVMQLVSDVILELNGVTLEHVKNPGLCFLLLNTIIQDADEASGNTEYAYDSFAVAKDDVFDVSIPLKNFLNFARDYKKFMIYSRFDLTLIRARNDYNAIMCAEVRTMATEAHPQVESAEIDIERISWKIPHIMLNDILKLKILKGIEHGKDI